MKDDHRLLLLGGFALIGSFFVGKAAIEGIAHARLQAQMHGPKQQHKSSAMDDFVKFVGIGLSLYTMVEQAPQLIEEAGELIGGVTP